MPLHASVIDEQTSKWKSNALTKCLRANHNAVEANDKTLSILEQDLTPGFTYKDLAMVKTKE